MPFATNQILPRKGSLARLGIELAKIRDASGRCTHPKLGGLAARAQKCSRLARPSTTWWSASTSHKILTREGMLLNGLSVPIWSNNQPSVLLARRPTRSGFCVPVPLPVLWPSSQVRSSKIIQRPGQLLCTNASSLAHHHHTLKLHAVFRQPHRFLQQVALSQAVQFRLYL